MPDKVEISKTEQRRLGRTPSTEISENQRQALQSIVDFTEANGFPPTMIELGSILGISNASTHQRVNYLVAKGYVKKEPGKARGLSVLRHADDAHSDICWIPVVGFVAAGTPILAEENVIGMVQAEVRQSPDARYFALKTQGESMMNAGINDGDVLVIRQQPVAHHGEIIVALLNGEATVKRLYYQNDRIELRPENNAYDPIVIGPDDSLSILGRVITSRHPGSIEYAVDPSIHRNTNQED